MRSPSSPEIPAHIYEFYPAGHFLILPNILTKIQVPLYNYHQTIDTHDIFPQKTDENNCTPPKNNTLNKIEVLPTRKLSMEAPISAGYPALPPPVPRDSPTPRQKFCRNVEGSQQPA